MRELATGANVRRPLTTISDRMKQTGGRTSGFDYLRFSLAASIILFHGIVTSYGPQAQLAAWRGPIGIAFHFVLPVFFALSGFLVAGSLDRCPTLVSFFGLRVLRIVPALGVEVTLSALVFGPLLTSRSLAGYFSDNELARYFLNLVGNIHYLLPGLFESNPLPRIVNAQLWTIPSELRCYLALGGLAAAATLRKRSLFLGMVVVLQALWAWQAIKLGDDGSSNGASGEVLVISFLAGVLFHLYRDRIPLHWGMFLPVLVLGVWLSSLPHGSYYLPFPAAYLTVYLGLLNPPSNRFLRSGDYSYGLYLYGFPLQQAVASWGPETHHWWVNVAVSFPAALLVAFCSWHLVERPTLSARRWLPAIEAALVGQVIPSRAGAAASSDVLSAIRQDQPLARRALAACALSGGPIGTFLFVDAHEGAGILMVAATFAASLLLARQGGAPARQIAGLQAAAPPE